MTGQELKQKISASGISQAELARRLEMSTQLMSQALNAADIKTGFLERIARAIGKPMSYFYPEASGEGGEVHVETNSGIVSGTNNGHIGTDQQAVIDRLLEANAKKDEQIDNLIRLLSSKVDV